MINVLPNYVNIIFILTTLLTLFLFYRSTNGSAASLIVIVAWLLLLAVLSYLGFFTDTEAVPPRPVIIAAPPLVLIFFLFITESGKKFIDSLDVKTLTLMHVVRIPVELCLYWLYLYKSVPELMTFAGRNFDIIAGLTAPFVFYFGYVKMSFNKTILLAWNIICISLLLNIVVNAVLSARTPFQQFAFDQPNTGVLYFPFVWLPGFIVPVVLLAHLTSIRSLLVKEK